MFKDTSDKLKMSAIIIFVVGTILTIIIGIAKLVNFFSVTEELRKLIELELWWGFGCMILGPCVSYVVALFFYGIGVMIEYQFSLMFNLRLIIKKNNSNEEGK